MHGVPPPMTGNYMPSLIHAEIDESQFSYGQKQSNTIETPFESFETCVTNGDESNESENSFDSCQSNSCTSTLESESESVVESVVIVPIVVMPKPWTDVPEFVPTFKQTGTPSHTCNMSAEGVKNSRDL
nr:hypothetical protein [Tanacetum cinerariifolium]